jgi:hypothetical protein
MATTTKTYDVTIRFQFPAWDETDGIPYEGIDASSKSDAIARVRRMAERDGHLPSVGKGRVCIRAEAQT